MITGTGRLLSLLIILTCGSCVAPLNAYNADRYFQLGLDYERAGDYAAARESFRRSLINAQSSGATAEAISALLYNLGRMYGYTCDFDSAENLLLEALEAERALVAPSAANISKRLGELARLTRDSGKFEQSAGHYAEGVLLLEELEIRSEDPIAYANYLDGYASALNSLGRSDAALAILADADGLRSVNEGRVAEFIPIEYRDVCNVAGAL